MLYERELNSYNRALKYASIFKMAFRVSFLPASETFTVEFVEIKKGGKSFSVQKVPPRDLHYQIGELIKKLEASRKEDKNVSKEG